MNELISIGIVHSCFTALFLATKRDRTLNDSVLAAWMVFMALPLLSGLSGHLLPDIQIPVLRSNLIYPLTYGPFMWLYVGTLTGDIGRLRPRNLVHFLPFAVVSLYQLIFHWTPALPGPEKLAFGTAIRSIGAVNLALLLAYTVAVIWRLRLHGKEVVEHFSELSSNITLNWLYWITLGVFGVFVLLFLGSVLSLPVLLEIHMFALVAFILALSFAGLRQGQIFDRQTVPSSPPDDAIAVRSMDRPARLAPEPTGPRARQDGTQDDDMRDESKARYSRSGLTEERAETITERLERYMRAERPYLDPELTIEKLAKRMAVPRHHVTQVINERHGKNFYLFVNEYRIEAVKRAMRAPEGADRTLLDIAYASGFNSKSTFNTAFKRLTGMTPSQYRTRMS
ncbi:helix-turn-helix domain-containing protein [Aliiruegeria sabulilitoris]|uniref:helix-turn-helix domain-containing protein n=1 Tax=Aliiruegeria sabulilitoris TaxID=1510458 RepID=UPI00082E64DA|nr:helix-turn-helix domain-containing protein [Aliiruegeria sabulilitoris]